MSKNSKKKNRLFKNLLGAKITITHPQLGPVEISLYELDGMMREAENQYRESLPKDG